MIPRSHLTRILRPRVEEILTAIRDRMQATGMMDICGRRFVLTGGGSELTGLPEVARRMLGRNVRNGRPMGIAGLPEMARGPAFATVGGMLIYPQICGQEFADPVPAGQAHRHRRLFRPRRQLVTLQLLKSTISVIAPVTSAWA